MEHVCAIVVGRVHGGGALGRRRGEAGYAMAVLLVGIAVMAVLATAVMPVWRHQAQREREEELIFRGTQYARAVALFQRKFPGAFPANVDALVTQKFLRRKYKDPMTADGEFQVVFQNSPGIATAPGTQPGRAPGREATQPAAPVATTSATGSTNLAGPQGGVVGVVSRSKEKSIKIFNGRSQYNEWQFDYTLVTRTVGTPGAPGTPGSQTPGQPVAPNGPGGQPPGGQRPGGVGPPMPGLGGGLGRPGGGVGPGGSVGTGGLPPGDAGSGVARPPGPFGPSRR